MASQVNTQDLKKTGAQLFCLAFLSLFGVPYILPVGDCDSICARGVGSVCAGLLLDFLMICFTRPHSIANAREDELETCLFR